MTSPGTPPIHDALVARLKADLTPVRPLWPPSVRLASWLVLAGLVVASAMKMGLRHDLAVQLRRPLYVLEVLTLLGASSAAASVALRGAVPGLGAWRTGYLAVVLGVLGTALLCSEPGEVAFSLGPFVQSGLQCACCIAMFGLLPWAFVFVAVGRGAPLEGRIAGTYAGAAGFLVGAAAVRVACPIDDPLHVLTWHMAPVVVWTAASVLVGSVWLVRWQRTPGRVWR